MTRAELRQAIIDNTGRTDKSDVANRALDLALTDMSLHHPFRLLRKEVASLDFSTSSSSMVLPEDTFKLVSLTLVDGTSSLMLTGVHKNQMGSVIGDVPASELTGRPRFYYEENNVIFFDRSADVDYVFKATIDVLPLAFASDSDRHPVPFLDAPLIAFGTAYVFRSLEQFENSREWMGEYMRALKAAIIADERTPNKQFIAEDYSSSPAPSGSPPPWLDPFNSGRGDGGW